MADLSALTTALRDLKEKDAKALVRRKLAAGVSATELLDACQAGLGQVGKRFETGEYFISELMYAGQIMKELMADLQPHLKKRRAGKTSAKTVVFGTVRGDIHDIGKDVCILMLRGAGYEVVDLGVNVAAEKFVEAVRKHQAFLLGMSVFLTTCCKAIEETVKALGEAGLRESVRIAIGGAAASPMVAERTGCDYFGATAVDAVTLAARAAG
jgi:5-methyltetrahydrofolate--homocysteine methyltransferase